MLMQLLNNELQMLELDTLVCIISDEYFRHDNEQELRIEITAGFEIIHYRSIVVVVRVVDLEDEFGVEEAVSIKVFNALKLSCPEFLAEIRDRNMLDCLRATLKGIDQSPTHSVYFVYCSQCRLNLNIPICFLTNLDPFLSDELYLLQTSKVILNHSDKDNGIILCKCILYELYVFFLELS